jgi:uncharacterized protein YegL
MNRRPGGELASRPLHFIWICDCSGSMDAEGKIQSLNNAIKEAIPSMQRVAEENPNAQVLVRAIRFSDSAQWHTATPTPVADFRWTDLKAGGMTDMGRAMILLADQLRIPPMSERALPPVLILLSDGQPTDDFSGGLAQLTALPWGKRAVRIAVAIGADADLDALRKFVGNSEMPILQANNAESLVNYIKWASSGPRPRFSRLPRRQPASIWLLQPPREWSFLFQLLPRPPTVRWTYGRSGGPGRSLAARRNQRTRRGPQTPSSPQPGRHRLDHRS